MSSLFDIINIPFSYVIKFFYSFTNNYMIALLGFAIVVKLVLFPIGIKTQKNMVKQASLRPREMAIRKKYAGRTDQATQQKMQQEIMNLYQAENYNPASGCLPMILQLLVVFAIYQIVYGPLTYLCSMSIEGVAALKTAVASLMGVEVYTGNEINLLRDISTLGIPAVIEAMGNVEGAAAEMIAAVEDILVNHWPNMTVFGGTLDLTQNPTIAFNVLLTVPILNLVTTVASQKIIRKLSYQPPEQAQQTDMSMKIMEWAMPLMIFWMAFQLPAALGVYWIYQNILAIIQQFILVKMYPYPTFTDEELKAAEKALNVSTKREKKSAEQKKVRSLHHIDDDDYEAPAPSSAPKQLKEKKSSAEPDEEKETVISKAPLKKDDEPKK